MRALPSQRVAVIGHSFTMDLHWSSPSAFVPIVTAMFARENPKVEFRQFEGGGLTSTRAYTRFFEDVLAWKPDRVLLVVLNRTDEDLEHFARLGKALTAAGARVRDHDRRGVSAPLHGARSRALRVPGRDPHDRALASPHGEGMAQAAG